MNNRNQKKEEEKWGSFMPQKMAHSQQVSITGPKEMSNFHQILQQQINVKRLCLIFAPTPLQMCLKKLDVQLM